jgi:hypothetical protein
VGTSSTFRVIHDLHLEKAFPAPLVATETLLSFRPWDPSYEDPPGLSCIAASLQERRALIELSLYSSYGFSLYSYVR